MGNLSKHQRDRMRRERPVYYDPIEYKKIKQILNSYPEIAYERSLDYIGKYPDDFLGNILYIKILLMLGKIQDADEHLDRVINSKSFNKRKTERELRTIKLLKKYIEGQRSINGYNSFILHVKHNKPEDSYLRQQIEDYSSEKFIEHIDRHIDNDNKIDTEKSRALFRYGIDINRIIKGVQNHLNSAPKIKYKYVDVYYFKYDGCGRYHGDKLTDYFQVVCISGTHNIITMYPMQRCSPEFCTDLNYLHEERYQQESQQESPKEKFLRKYRQTIFK